jgi:hypothetical protein
MCAASAIYHILNFSRVIIPILKGVASLTNRDIRGKYRKMPAHQGWASFFFKYCSAISRSPTSLPTTCFLALRTFSNPRGGGDQHMDGWWQSNAQAMSITATLHRGLLAKVRSSHRTAVSFLAIETKSVQFLRHEPFGPLVGQLSRA